MKTFNTELDEIKIIENPIFNDERGFFYESFNIKNFSDLISKDIVFVQDNHSKSMKNVIRGLHYQIPPFAQAKLIKVISGTIYDVAVDIRRSSPTFGKWVGVILSAQNRKQLWIPEGFAHGFLSLSNETEVIYKTNNFYDPESENVIFWNDKDIRINWQDYNIINPIMSIKDKNGKPLKEAKLFD